MHGRPFLHGDIYFYKVQNRKYRNGSHKKSRSHRDREAND